MSDMTPREIVEEIDKHIIGQGIIQSTSEISVTNGNKNQKIVAKKIIIATGGRPKEFPGVEFDGKKILTSKAAMTLDSPPAKLVSLGAGAIGVEFAYFYNEFGSEVHLIEMMPNILPNEDLEISIELERNFKKFGINIYTNTKMSRLLSIKIKNQKLLKQIQS